MSSISGLIMSYPYVLQLRLFWGTFNSLAYQHIITATLIIEVLFQDLNKHNRFNTVIKCILWRSMYQLIWAEWAILCYISDKYHLFLLLFHRQLANNLSNTDSKCYDSSYPKSLPDLADWGICLALIGERLDSIKWVWTETWQWQWRLPAPDLVCCWAF